MDLTPEERRVAACLVEKQLTTPHQYPLTLNALVLACNQASNRNPVVDYGDSEVEEALARLKERGLVRFVHPSHGRSVTRYRHVLDEALGLDTPQMAVLAVLALRGPQTPGEVRGRTERMAHFANPAEVERELEGLSARPDPLVARMPREPGRKEIRYSDLLAGEASVPAGWERPWAALPEPDLAPGSPASLADEVAALRAEVEALRRDLDEVIERLTR